MQANPYVKAVSQALPRVLALFDADRTSASHGMGDRFHWAWGLIDFANATYQGAAHGLARLWRSGHWPYATDPSVFHQRIDAMFESTSRLSRADGSLEEAFPHEGSFCVTALVAFDLLCAMQLLASQVPPTTQARWRDVIAPLIKYLLVADETHGMISNHLATAAAALARWHDVAGDPRSDAKARVLVDRILAHQSGEGWFREYDGADPGYQSLCTVYLADLHLRRPHWALADPLARSVEFLWHFAHPDGSFGGLYGSRCTRFYFPAGIEALAPESAPAAALATFMRDSIDRQLVVALASIDDTNLLPMFNAYCWAAELWSRGTQRTDLPVLPALRRQPQRQRFTEAGLWIDAGPRHYSVISTHKGGVVAHFVDGRLAVLDAGVVVRDRRGRLGSSQAMDAGNGSHVDGEQIVVEAHLRPMSRRRPTPAEFVLLRLLCLTVMRWRVFREWLKRQLVRMLIAPHQPWRGGVTRRIGLGPNLTIHDEVSLPPGCDRVDSPGAFVSLHMASQGYWQLQDETPPR